MNIDKNTQQIASTDATAYLIHAANIADADRFLGRVVPNSNIEPVRRRADAANAGMARAGRHRAAFWGVALLFLALGFGVFAGFTAGYAIWLGSMAAVCLAAGVMLILLFDPAHAMAGVETFARFTDDAHDEWTRSAQTHVAARLADITSAIDGAPAAAISAGHGVREVVAAARSAAAQARRIDLEIDRRRQTAVEAVNTADEEYRKRMGDLRSRIRGWGAKLWGAAVRRDAGRVLDAREKLVAARRTAETLEMARTAALLPVIRSLDGTAAEVESEAVNPLVALAESAARESSEILEQGARGPFGKIVPPAAEVAARARDVICPRVGAIANAVSGRQARMPLAEAISIEVRAALDRTPVAPKDLASYFASLNGGTNAALAQLANESAELTVTKPIPGREARRLRAVMVTGGPASSLTREIEARSEGYIVRGIHIDDQRQLIQVTESRYEPGAEIIELREATGALQLVGEDAKAAMVTAVDDDELVLAQTRPEERDRPDKGLRLLALGLALELVVRHRAIYELKAPAGAAPGGIIGRSFEDAVEKLHGDTPQSRRLQAAIAADTAARGSDGTRTVLKSAMQRPALVPAEHAERIAIILAAEIEQI